MCVYVYISIYNKTYLYNKDILVFCYIRTIQSTCSITEQLATNVSPYTQL